MVRTIISFSEISLHSTTICRIPLFQDMSIMSTYHIISHPKTNKTDISNLSKLPRINASTKPELIMLRPVCNDSFVSTPLSQYTLAVAYD